MLKLSEAELDAFTGVYNNPHVSALTVKRRGNILVGEAIGMKFPMVPYAENRFYYGASGYDFEFNPETNEMTIKAGPQELVFTKE